MTFLEHSFSDRALLLTLAIFINVLFGGPRWLHLLLHLNAPSQFVKNLFSFFVIRMNRAHRSDATRRNRGAFIAVIVLVLALLLGVLVSLLSIQTRMWMLAELILLAMMLGIRQSFDLAAEVRKLLSRKEVDAAKRLLQPEVKQDLAPMDEYAVARAAIEFLGHRLVSGMVSPAFWYFIGGLPLALPAIAMHRLSFFAVRPIPRYQPFAPVVKAIESFYRALPTGITVLLMLFVMPVVPGSKGNAARKAAREENPQNLLITDYPVLSVIARAFGIAVQGPCTVESHPVAYPWIGEGSARLGPPDILRMQFLYGYAAGVFLLLIAALNLISFK
ncbi:MAG: cobalamin biosynthesis protein [Rickettsiales bacterium]